MNKDIKIAIGSDHRGFEYKNEIIQKTKDVFWLDFGCFSSERCDYPVFAQLVSQSILEKKADLGVLLCGSGIGMSIAANRFTGIYAGLCWNSQVAQSAKEDDNINILVLPTDFVSFQEFRDIIDAWLQAQFKGGHYQERLDMIEKF